MASAQFPNQRVNIATHIKKYTKEAQILPRGNGIGFGYAIDTSRLVAVFGTAAVPLIQPLADSGVSAGTLATVTGLTVREYFAGVVHRTVFTLAAVPITLLDATVGKGTKIYDFPTGLITIQSAAGQVAEITTSVLASTLNTGITYNWGVGTVTQANGTLATTEQDIIPTTNGVASATINVTGAVSKGVRTTAPVQFDGHSAAKSLYFNVGIATNTDIDADATTTWTGTLEVWWMINTAGN